MMHWASLSIVLLGVLQTCIGYEVALVGPDNRELSSDREDHALSYCGGIRTGKAQDALIGITFKAPFSGFAALAVYRDDEQKHLGRVVDGRDEYICTDALAQQNVCTTSEVGSYLVSPDGYKSDYLSLDTVNLGQMGSVYMHFDINTTGLYCVSVMLLPAPGGGPSTTNSIILDFQNGQFTGHLSASEWPKLPWHGWLILLYLMATGAWFSICGMNRDILLPIHHVFSLIGIMAAIEQAWAWGYYTAVNAFDSHLALAGRRAMWSMSAAARHTLTLTVILLLANGYGITRERKCTLPVIVLALCHAIFTAIYNGYCLSNKQVSQLKEFIFVVPLAITWTFYMQYIRTGLTNVISSLEHKRQGYRKILYSRLTSVLLGFTGSWSVLSLLDVLFFFRFFPLPWRLRWIFDDAIPSTLDFAVIAFVAYIFNPQNFNRLTVSNIQVPQSDELEARDFDLSEIHDDDDDVGNADSIPLQNVRDKTNVFSIDDDEAENEPFVPSRKNFYKDD